ncbi:MAG: hypothetical protein E4H14_15590 [Candidatus Thorarchaeota archaeon]|nr:MAG: hypothetical protein E4H14_15590 [Candidatus Thorarchaeota archaeon]
MGDGIKKKTSLNVDSSIADVLKRAKARRKKLDSVANLEKSNPLDDLNEQLERDGMLDVEKEIFDKD